MLVQKTVTTNTNFAGRLSVRMLRENTVRPQEGKYPKQLNFLDGGNENFALFW